MDSHLKEFPWNKCWPSDFEMIQFFSGCIDMGQTNFTKHSPNQFQAYGGAPLLNHAVFFLRVRS